MKHNVPPSIYNTMTKHASMRLKQRGISKKIIEIIYDHHDQWKYAGKGCSKLSLSDDAIAELAMNDYSRKTIERTRGVIILVSSDDRIVTIMHNTIQPKRSTKPALYQYARADNYNVSNYNE